MGSMYELSSRGHGVVVRWDPERAKEVETARATFDLYRQRGHTMFRLDDDDEQGERMETFDPTAGRIVAVPRMAGG